MLSSILLLQSVVMLIWSHWSHTPARRTTRPTTRIIKCKNNYFDQQVCPGHSLRKHAYCYFATLPPESLVTRLSVETRPRPLMLLRLYERRMNEDRASGWKALDYEKSIDKKRTVRGMIMSRNEGGCLYGLVFFWNE